ncbi:hypothetical protein J7355_16685 [Endozoicomonas sp. G2_2]|uniref:hypothetical protein n=1 Tax=Endozoicomonas sp. G2_2 TaxID=2821092 RepID=UPI001ADCE96A|nr:hypothetical protein [Endozoicomonas sp. G2_2]MBO9471729.1 hypothetical protein [Endozoicomonas sp. G2_2]
MTDLNQNIASGPHEDTTARDSRSVLFFCAGIGLVVAKLLYIAVELYYNNTLQIFGSTPGIDADDIERFHLFGRQVAAVGATLLIGGLYLRWNAKRVHRGLGRPRWLVLGGVAVGVYLSALALQSFAINLMIDLSSDRTAYRAYAGGIAQTLVLSGVGEAFGLDASIDRYDMMVDDSETMLSLLPVASIGTDSFARRLAGNREAISAAMRAQAFHTRFRVDLGRFVAAQRELVALWSTMNDVSVAVDDKVWKARKAILEPRLESFRLLVSKYQDYRKAQKYYERALPRLSASNRKRAYRTFVERVDLPPNLTAREFFNRPEVRVQSGLYSDGNAPAAMSIVADGNRLASERDRMLETATAELADRLPPSLVPYIAFDRRFKSFLTLPPIRDRVQAMDAGGQGHDLGMSGTSFFQNVWAPRVSREVEKTVDQYVLANPAAIATAEMKELRINALKAAYVMPLALCLSTMFLLLNLLTLVRWRKMSIRGRVVVAGFVGAILMMTALNPLDGNGTLDSDFDLPVGVEQIARTSRLINGFGTMLTQLVPPTWFGLVPESVCNQRRSIYQSSDGTLFNCFQP